jgi:hypothetical protein
MIFRACIATRSRIAYVDDSSWPASCVPLMRVHHSSSQHLQLGHSAAHQGPATVQSGSCNATYPLQLRPQRHCHHKIFTPLPIHHTLPHHPPTHPYHSPNLSPPFPPQLWSRAAAVCVCRGGLCSPYSPSHGPPSIVPSLTTHSPTHPLTHHITHPQTPPCSSGAGPPPCACSGRLCPQGQPAAAVAHAWPEKGRQCTQG